MKKQIRASRLHNVCEYMKSITGENFQIGGQAEGGDPLIERWEIERGRIGDCFRIGGQAEGEEDPMIERWYIEREGFGIIGGITTSSRISAEQVAESLFFIIQKWRKNLYED